MREPRLFPEEVAMIARRLAEGATYMAVAAELDRSASTTHRYAERLGLRPVTKRPRATLPTPRNRRPSRQPTGRRPGRPGQPVEVIERVLTLREQHPGISINATAKQLGVSREIVTRILVQAGRHPARRSRVCRGERSA